MPSFNKSIKKLYLSHALYKIVKTKNYFNQELPVVCNYGMVPLDTPKQNSSLIKLTVTQDTLYYFLLFSKVRLFLIRRERERVIWSLNCIFNIAPRTLHLGVCNQPANTPKPARPNPTCWVELVFRA